MKFTTTPIQWACGIELHRVENPEGAKLTERLAQLTGIQKQRGRYNFPGPNPVSIERSDYPKLRAQPYHITEKTDGVRALLCIIDFEETHVALVFDRTLTPYLFPIYHMPRALYQGTVFDGEIVYDKLENRWVFLIFDAMEIAGVPVFHLPFSERLTATITSLQFYKDRSEDAGLLRPKHFLPFLKEVEPAFHAHVDSIQKRYATDGIIFMPERDEVVYGRHNNLMKLKTVHSIDFLVKNGKLHIYDETSRRNKMIGTPTGPKKEMATEGCIVECVLDPQSKKSELWEVLSVRTDKNTSNNKFTYEKTLINMQEALNLHEVLQGAFEVSAHGNPIWN
jgi:hypothetical protein